MCHPPQTTPPPKELRRDSVASTLGRQKPTVTRYSLPTILLVLTLTPAHSPAEASSAQLNSSYVESPPTFSRSVSSGTSSSKRPYTPEDDVLASLSPPSDTPPHHPAFTERCSPLARNVPYHTYL